MDLGFRPTLRSTMPRMTPTGWEVAETWSVDLDKRAIVPDDRPQEHAGDVGKRDAPINPEVAGYRTYLGKDK
jgi:hypothetical protein